MFAYVVMINLRLSGKGASPRGSMHWWGGGQYALVGRGAVCKHQEECTVEIKFLSNHVCNAYVSF